MKNMKNVLPTTTSSNIGMHSTAELQQQIGMRAYDLYELRGREDGHDREDWLQAECDVLQEVSLPVAA